MPEWRADVVVDEDDVRGLIAAQFPSLALPAPEAPAVVHGDLHVRHLLVDRAGGLTGVIDWGDLCRADPSVDLILFWSFLPPRAREARSWPATGRWPRSGSSVPAAP